MKRMLNNNLIVGILLISYLLIRNKSYYLLKNKIMGYKEGLDNDENEYGVGFIMFISIIMMIFGSQGRDGGSQMLFLSGMLLLIFSSIFKMLGF